MERLFRFMRDGPRRSAVKGRLYTWAAIITQLANLPELGKMFIQHLSPSRVA